MTPQEKLEFLHYLEAKVKPNCYPYEHFCTHCKNTWLKNGQEWMKSGEITKPDVSDWKSCIVFFDGYISCYHGTMQHWVRGNTLEDEDGNVICQGFKNSPYGRG